MNKWTATAGDLSAFFLEASFSSDGVFGCEDGISRTINCLGTGAGAGAGVGVEEGEMEGIGSTRVDLISCCCCCSKATGVCEGSGVTVFCWTAGGEARGR